MQQESHYHVKHLDDALNTISKVRMIFCRMNLASKEKLLKEMVHRVVVNQDGQIINVEWLLFFGYLQEVSALIKGETTCLSAISLSKSSNRVSSGPSFHN